MFLSASPPAPRGPRRGTNNANADSARDDMRQFLALQAKLPRTTRRSRVADDVGVSRTAALAAHVGDSARSDLRGFGGGGGGGAVRAPWDRSDAEDGRRRRPGSSGTRRANGIAVAAEGSNGPTGDPLAPKPFWMSSTSAPAPATTTTQPPPASQPYAMPPPPPHAMYPGYPGYAPYAPPPPTGPNGQAAFPYYPPYPMYPMPYPYGAPPPPPPMVAPPPAPPVGYPYSTPASYPYSDPAPPPVAAPPARPTWRDPSPPPPPAVNSRAGRRRFASPSPAPTTRAADPFNPDPEPSTIRAKQAAYLRDLEAQVLLKRQRADKDAELRRILDERKDREAESYNPFGRGGAGAPLRDAEGGLVTNRAQAAAMAAAEAKAREEVAGGGGRRSVMGGGGGMGDYVGAPVPAVGNGNSQLQQLLASLAGTGAGTATGLPANVVGSLQALLLQQQQQQQHQQQLAVPGLTLGLASPGLTNPLAALSIPNLAGVAPAPVTAAAAPTTTLPTTTSSDALPWLRDDARAKQLAAQQKLQDALKEQIAAKERAKAEELARQQREEAAELARLHAEQEELKRKHEMELEADRAREEAEAAAKIKGKAKQAATAADAGSGARPAAAAAAAAVVDPKEEAMRSKAEEEALKRRNKHVRARAGTKPESSSSPAPPDSPPPPAAPFRSSSPPIPTLRKQWQQTTGEPLPGTSPDDDAPGPYSLPTGAGPYSLPPGAGPTSLPPGASLPTAPAPRPSSSSAGVKVTERGVARAPSTTLRRRASQVAMVTDRSRSPPLPAIAAAAAAAGMGRSAAPTPAPPLVAAHAARSAAPTPAPHSSDVVDRLQALRAELEREQRRVERDLQQGPTAAPAAPAGGLARTRTVRRPWSEAASLAAGSQFVPGPSAGWNEQEPAAATERSHRPLSRGSTLNLDYIETVNAARMARLRALEQMTAGDLPMAR
ncbi:hypothetical protein AMAG_11123 [Allomyces macrogynus ATCC 38327]|uniref:Uncharacterized protein n=1 Tax=Allomyces macrogynus (strain ATCC 38327) TaxID=578462 RepID=A0A0L0ST05_ALLM3|nr:hypothetical protein AMAG_11123 [Allomyces macrogynus ATCC 38327]|eukprot:KNE65505.1 hypothetical protein AMAG_11123 [Allomyces macrogynus ATCC 38327]